MISLVPKPRSHGGKGSGTHQAFFCTHAHMYVCEHLFIIPNQLLPIVNYVHAVSTILLPASCIIYFSLPNNIYWSKFSLICLRLYIATLISKSE